MAAVVGPVGVEHADLRDRGIAPLLVFEVIAAADDVVKVHGEALFLAEGLELFVAPCREAVDRLHLGGDLIAHHERLGLLEGGEAALDRVHHMLLHGGDLRLRQVAREEIDLRRAHERALAAAHQLDALLGGVAALVKLPGERLDREDGAVKVRQLGVNVVHLRLGEDRAHGLLKALGRDVFHVVAVQDAHLRRRRDAEEALNFRQQRGGLLGEFFLLFSVNAIDHVHSPSHVVRTNLLRSAAPQAARLRIRASVLPLQIKPASLGFDLVLCGAAASGQPHHLPAFKARCPMSFR